MLVFLNSASACTIFTATKGKTVLFASNEDQSPNQSYLVVDASGKHGVVFIATSTAEFPFVMQMGINEHGLSYDINSISKESLVHIPNTIQQKEWALVELMKEVQSVNEMLDKFFKYDWGNSISYQIHIADRFGDAAVIHPGRDGKLTFTRIDKNKDYLISTNFNLRDIKFDKLLSPRYQIADHKLKTVLNNGELTYEFMASVLDATHQEQGWINPIKTIYSVVLDLNTLDIHLYYDGKFDRSYLLNVKSELSKVSGKKIIPMTEVLASKINN
ncbi:MAG: hypothetical protein EOO52_07080 [Gammaproteobacteria bacterium]|nr:MAG: hypothetical protein EOO52_07080 [Gammaproteobacteria bacterium]